ncbi:hypothetical protein KFZ76_03810 [Methylovulum psychrotolerans]|uniref:hypothetical protein n=1 Tax=Methylovulum psychrotolerans TaxID=1704499 RepID=UPI001BFFD58A|nr:hypothetical protein [Methylovulum psychrotolerans]MBT9096837.1 hypothetical protein [Methylovulum psychrotolerans]
MADGGGEGFDGGHGFARALAVGEQALQDLLAVGGGALQALALVGGQRQRCGGFGGEAGGAAVGMQGGAEEPRLADGAEQ